MDCRRIENEELMDEYLAGRLDGDERKAFETHCASCAPCLEKLELRRHLQAEFWNQTPVADSKTARERRTMNRPWAWASAVAVALVALGLGIWWGGGRLAQRRAGGMGLASEWAGLAAFTPPLYVPPVLRGAESDAAASFRKGMTSYQEGRYASAIPALQAAKRLDPEAPNIAFFLGICCLLSDRTTEGIAELDRTITLGDPAYQAEARFFLAKGLLRRGDWSRARRELEEIADSGGGMSQDASRLIEQIDAKLRR
jgi:tetratricopeptide (TPR) repeat protein